MSDGPVLVVRVAGTIDELKKNLAEGVNQIETTSSALAKMASSYDGSKIIQQAAATAAAIQQIGGVTNLTAAEQTKANIVLQGALDKYAALGRQAPAGMLALADSMKPIAPVIEQQSGALSKLVGSFAELAGAVTLGGVVALGAKLVETGSHLQDVSERTDISISALQRLDVVARQNGTTLDAVSMAVFQMGKRIAGDNDSAAAAARELGLSWEALKAMSPEQAFYTIGTAIGQLPNAMEKSSTGAALFGRSVQDLIPVFNHLNDATGTYVSLSTDQVQTLHGLDQAWQRASFAVSAFRLADENLHLTQLKEDIDLLRGSIGEMPAVIDLWTQMMQKRTAPAITAGLTHEKEIVAQLDEEYKKNRAQVEEMDSAGEGWKGTIIGINGAVAEAVKWYLAAGVSQSTLADQYGLTATQVKALSSALREENDAQKKIAESTAEDARLWDDYTEKITSRGAEPWETEQARVDKYFLDLAAKRQAAGTDTDAFYAAWSADWDAASAHIQTGEDQLLAKFEEAEQRHISLAEDGVKHFGATTTAVVSNVVSAVATATAALARLTAYGASPTTTAQQLSGTRGNTIVGGSNGGALTGEYGDRGLGGGFYNYDPQNITTAADAAKGVSTYRLTPGGQIDVTPLTAALLTQMGGSEGAKAVLAQIEAEFSQYPGRAPGGTGATGLASNDAVGFSQLLNEQILYMRLKKTFPGYADGVASAPGGWSVVGERGPEMMYVPPASTILPHGSSMGATQITFGPGSIVLNYPIVNDPRAVNQLVSLLGDGVMRKLRAAGMKTPAGT